MAHGSASTGWTGWRAGCALIVLGLAVYLPGLWTIPPVDRDESRFAQASRQMVESGDYVVPRVQDRPRLNKPPLIYWLQSTSAKLLGDEPGKWPNGNIWVFRLPSVLCAIGAVLLTWRIGTRMFGPHTGIVGAGLLALTPMVIWDAHQARADQLLLLTVVATQGALWAAWMPGREPAARRQPVVEWAWAMGFWIALGLGVLAKGPITPLIAMFTAASVSTLTRRWRWIWTGLKPLWGVPVLLAVVGPWVYAVGTQVGWDRYVSIVWSETIGRSGDAAEGHWGPPGYHTVLLSVLMWPGSMLTLMAMVAGVKCAWGVWRTKGQSSESTSNPVDGWQGTVFLVSWILPAWVMFELIATKLPHYTMPLYPALALLSGKAAVELTESRGTLIEQARTLGSRIGFAVWVTIGYFGLSMSMVLIAAFGGFGEIYGRPAAWAFGIGTPLLLGVFLWLAMRATRTERLVRAHMLGGACVVAWVWAVLGVVLPKSERVWISPRLERSVAALAEGVSSAPLVGLVGFQEDSAVFMLRGHCEQVDPQQAVRWMQKHGREGAVLAIDTLRHADVAGRIAEKWDFGARIDGYNYSVGRRVIVEVYSDRSATSAGRERR